MDLLSKIFGVKRTPDLFEFNRDTLLKDASRLARTFNDVKSQEGHQNLVDFLKLSMNLEILALSEQKELSSDAYAYRRGKIDAIRGILANREQAIANSKKEKETKGNKTPSDNPAKRSYLKQVRSGGGILD